MRTSFWQRTKDRKSFQKVCKRNTSFFILTSADFFLRKVICAFTNLCRAKRKTAKWIEKYGQKEKIDELCFLYVPTFVSVMNEVLRKVQPMINKQMLKRQKFCVLFLRCMLYFAHTKRFYIHIFTLTEYDSYKYQGY